MAQWLRICLQKKKKKESACNTANTGDKGSTPGLGRSPE